MLINAIVKIAESLHNILLSVSCLTTVILFVHIIQTDPWSLDLSNVLVLAMLPSVLQLLVYNGPPDI